VHNAAYRRGTKSFLVFQVFLFSVSGAPQAGSDNLTYRVVAFGAARCVLMRGLEQRRLAAFR
jgi:hypothetical protein